MEFDDDDTCVVCGFTASDGGGWRRRGGSGKGGSHGRSYDPTAMPARNARPPN
jgi:hypothetical protein